LNEKTTTLVRDWIDDSTYQHMFFLAEGIFFVANSKKVQAVAVDEVGRSTGIPITVS
jgi:hypothetical protein